MTIEVTSVPERHQNLLLQFVQFLRIARLSRVVRLVRTKVHNALFGDHRLFYRSLLGLLVISTVFAGDALRRSYKHYSSIIDSRLANGYLTSRPGLYAAPRILRIGQGLSPAQLVSILQRAGYVESAAGEVWSGSFQRDAQAIEIHPNFGASRAATVRVAFEDNRISDLTADSLALASFALEPEVLSNDLSVKAGQRKALAFNEIPPLLVHAILSIEDRRFFEHNGIDVFGLARAFLRNAGDDRLGQGGSTITQQLVKNTYLTPEKTFERKYAEAMLAIALERRLSKQDIFALYCNEVYLGQRGAIGVRGVNQAAQVYFGKELKDLSLPEAALIAGMIQGPSRYSPLRHPDVAQYRRNLVLDAMARDRWITEAQAGAASKSKVEVANVVASERSMAPYFVDYVNRTVEQQSATSGEQQRIYTTIDLDLQQIAEKAISGRLARLDSLYSGRSSHPQVAFVALDPHTGNVLAMVGGRDYAESQMNRATDALRQPGSTFKPFVFAAAIEDGFSPVRMFPDAPHDFVYDRTKIYRPANFGDAYSMQDVTMRTGLVKSLNVVTVDVALQTGLARIANLAAQFGLPKPDRYPALALGTSEATPLQLAAAYAVFANGGVKIEPKVTVNLDQSSQPPETGGQPAGVQVISPTTAYIMTNILSAVIDHGTARAARNSVKGTALAGKTGTSRDGWFVGYSPNLVCAVWVGFDDNQQLGLTGAEAALPIWTDFMSAAIDFRPELGGRTFDCPEGIKFVEIDNDTGLLSTLTCPNRELIAVTESLAPNSECYRHGNLPAIQAEETPEVVESTTLAQQGRRPAESFVSFDLKTLRTTRVDVDPSGRRTLVNVMR